jgi:phytoene dehydrogenase-like protein
LLPDGTLDSRTRTKVDFIPGCSSGVAPFKIDMAVAERVTFPRHPRPDGLDLREPTLLTGGLENIIRSSEECRAGRIPDSPSLWLSTPTATDPSQAPPGHDVLYLYSPLMPLQPQVRWSQRSGEAEKRIVGKAAEFMSGLEHEIGRSVENPDDMAERVRTTPGHQVFHVDFNLLRSGPLRPAFGLGGFRTPVPGLFLGGAGCHPGPGVSGVPGRLSAKELLRAARRLR